MTFFIGLENVRGVLVFCFFRIVVLVFVSFFIFELVSHDIRSPEAPEGDYLKTFPACGGLQRNHLSHSSERDLRTSLPGVGMSDLTWNIRKTHECVFLYKKGGVELS